jgi:putative peptidoglycan lipid II flippase
VVIANLGIGSVTDALFAAMVVPQLVLSIVSGSLVQVLVPTLAVLDDADFERSAWYFFLVASGSFTVAALALFLSAAFWIPLVVPGFDRSTVELAIALTRIQLPAVVFGASTSVLLAAAYARQRFIWPELSSLLTGLLAIAALATLLPRVGVWGAAWVNTGRAALQVLTLIPVLGRWPGRSARPPGAEESWRRLRPLLAGTVYYKLDVLVDRVLSSMAPAGGLTTYFVAQQLWNGGTQVLNKAVATPVLPAFSRLAREGSAEEFLGSYWKRLAFAFKVSLVPVVAFLIAGRPLLRLLEGHGGVTAANVGSLSLVMIALSGGVVAGVVGFISSAAFFAHGDTKTPTRIGVVSFTLYVPAKMISFHYLGLVGMALATSLFVGVNTLAQVVLFNRIMRRKSAAS